MCLYQFFGLKEAFEVSHLPNTSENKDDSLGNGPPQNPLVGAFAGHAESLFSILQNGHNVKNQKHDCSGFALPAHLRIWGMSNSPLPNIWLLSKHPHPPKYQNTAFQSSSPFLPPLYLAATPQAKPLWPFPTFPQTQRLTLARLSVAETPGNSDTHHLLLFFTLTAPLG